MDKIEQWITSKFSAHDGLLKKSFLFTYLWGLAAHGYLFFSNSITHDSIDEFINSPDMMAHKFGLGRIFDPLVFALRGSISAPWWLGILCLLWLSFAVYLVLRLFQIRENWKIALTSGILTVNISLTALVATYIHDVDCNALGIFLAVLAVYLWRQGKSLWGALPVAGTLGLYQAYVSVTITLVIMLSILDLLQGRKWKEVFLPGLKAAAMVVAGGLVYLILLKIAPMVAGIDLTTGDYNTLDGMQSLSVGLMARLTLTTWLNTVFCLLTVPNGMPTILSAGVHALLLLVCVVSVAVKLFDKTIGTGEKVLLVVLGLALPICMDVTRILSAGMSHDLMHYAMWLVYLIVLLLPQKKEWVRILASVLVCLTLVSNVQASNTIYTAKRFIQDANLSFFTRILSDVEDQEGYVAGQTEIIFIGEPGLGLKQLPEQYLHYATCGFDTGFAIGTPIQAHYQCYFDYVLMYPGVVAPDAVTQSYIWHPDVMEMPEYPQPGSIAMMDGYAVVKLGAYR